MLYPENSIILAPLAGYTDIPFRESMYRHGATHTFTEMIDAQALTYAFEKNQRHIQFSKHEKNLGLQLVCATPETFEGAINLIRHLPFFCIDFNLGCPAPKVAKKGEGARLARENPTLALHCIEALKKAVKNDFPVTVKTRILSETDPQETIDFCKKIESAGASALTLHGRVMEKFYSGNCFAEIIRLVQENLSIPVIANGGVFSYETAEFLRIKSGCSRLMIARGAMGNPWIFNEIEQNNNYVPPSLHEVCEELTCYLHAMIMHYGEELGLKVARKTVLDFLRGRGFSGELRAHVAHLITIKDVSILIDRMRINVAEGYWQWLEHNPMAERRMRK